MTSSGIKSSLSAQWIRSNFFRWVELGFYFQMKGLSQEVQNSRCWKSVSTVCEVIGSCWQWLIFCVLWSPKSTQQLSRIFESSLSASVWCWFLLFSWIQYLSAMLKLLQDQMVRWHINTVWNWPTASPDLNPIPIYMEYCHDKKAPNKKMQKELMAARHNEPQRRSNSC